MAGILCEQCGFLNPEGSVECEICAEPLVKKGPAPAPVVEREPVPVSVSATAPVEESVPASAPVVPAVPALEPVAPAGIYQTQTVQQNPNPPADSSVEYFVVCPESSTKTVVASPEITSYFCKGCQTEHFIDGMIWTVESRRLNDSTAQQTTQPVVPKEDNLWLEEVNSRFRIDIAKPGGTLGRYGNFGGDYFLSRSMNTVSGEHCLFRYEFNNWTLTHISRTNQTKYDGMIMSSNEPTLLEDGKVITLANTVSFVVRIG